MHKKLTIAIAALALSAACGPEELPGDEASLDVVDSASEDALCDTSVSVDQELFIKDLSVVEDPVRTNWSGALGNPKDGAWHFGRLMTNMAGNQNASDFVENWLKLWDRDQQVNGFNAPARGRVRDLILDAWPRKRDGKLDLTKAP